MNKEVLTSIEMKERGYDSTVVSLAEKAEQGHKKALGLILEIEKQFKKIQRPDITLHVARALDDEWNLSKEKVKELRLLDPEEDWKEVSDHKIECFQEYFNFSDDEGWHFYLPAFIRNYLKSFPNHGYDAVYWACLERKRLSKLNKVELDCVDKFLNLVYEYETKK